MEKLIRNDTHEQFRSPNHITNTIILIRKCSTCGAQYIITVIRDEKGRSHERIYCMLPNGALQLVAEGKHPFKCHYCGGERVSGERVI